MSVKLNWTELHSHSQGQPSPYKEVQGRKPAPCSLGCWHTGSLLSLYSHTSVLHSAVRPIYTFSRDTLPLIEDWKQKSRAELKKSARLIGTTGLIFAAPSDSAVAARIAQAYAWLLAPWAVRLTGKHKGLSSGSSVLYTELLCRIHQSSHPGAPYIILPQKAMLSPNQPSSKCYVDYLLSQTRPLKTNHYLQDKQGPMCTRLPRVAMIKAGLFITICSWS